ncbi:hypothetical protein HYH03_008807 [Edaphochlamys debaryana]|uniref:Uncharacterized protein n=1 Tax=Edaphochlamys debaryana TaxID=47281 RepID=A0A835Y1E2_9CHLO|nr:hypothetical protein HYH03_008807 [Edaphochlamys debaryana]|eukprot:KAG2492893.1 hypothetical protein HYH03_008807 [Edaphochlamys debaryana]
MIEFRPALPTAVLPAGEMASGDPTVLVDITFRRSLMQQKTGQVTAHIAAACPIKASSPCPATILEEEEEEGAEHDEECGCTRALPTSGGIPSVGHPPLSLRWEPAATELPSSSPSSPLTPVSSCGGFSASGAGNGGSGGTPSRATTAAGAMASAATAARMHASRLFHRFRSSKRLSVEGKEAANSGSSGPGTPTATATAAPFLSSPVAGRSFRWSGPQPAGGIPKASGLNRSGSGNACWAAPDDGAAWPPAAEALRPLSRLVTSNQEQQSASAPRPVQTAQHTHHHRHHAAHNYYRPHARSCGSGSGSASGSGGGGSAGRSRPDSPRAGPVAVAPVTPQQGGSGGPAAQLVSPLPDSDVVLALQALKLAAQVYDNVWGPSSASADEQRRDVLLAAAEPLYRQAMAAARGIGHATLGSLVKQAVRRYCYPGYGAPEDALRVILELLTGCGYEGSGANSNNDGACACVSATASGAAAGVAGAAAAAAGTLPPQLQPQRFLPGPATPGPLPRSPLSRTSSDDTSLHGATGEGVSLASSVGTVPAGSSAGSASSSRTSLSSSLAIRVSRSSRASTGSGCIQEPASDASGSSGKLLQLLGRCRTG